MQHDDGLMDGGGAATFKFEKIGDQIEGQIVYVEKKQQSDFQTGKPKTYDNGDPMFQWIFTIQTQLHDHVTDDGQRRIFGKNKLLSAIREAVRVSGHKGSTVGGTLKVQYSGDEPPKTRGFSPAKLFRAKYTPPARDESDSDASGWSDDPPSDIAPQDREPQSVGHRPRRQADVRPAGRPSAMPEPAAVPDEDTPF